MHKIAFFLLLCLGGLSCSKDNIIAVIPATKQEPIKLEIEKLITDSTITLKWTRFTGNKFQEYSLSRSGWYFKNGVFDYNSEIIDVSNDVNHVSFTDLKMPVSTYINYAINIKHNDTSLINRGFIASDGLLYTRPNALAYGLPKDVLYDEKQDRVYITDQNKVSLVNCTNSRMLASAEFPAGIGFCSMGDFNGAAELYVPANDGWLNILDANTLQTKDRIFVAGTYIGSVVAAQGILYIASSDKQFGYNDCIKIYNRATKTLLGRTGDWDATRLFQLAGADIALIDLTINLLPTDLSYFRFSADGTLLEKKNDTYHGDHQMDANIVRSFPDGKKFITSSAGSVFDTSLVFEKATKYNGAYSDFAFNEDGSVIYSANLFELRIDAINYPDLTTRKTYPTKYHPFKIFRTGNRLISVGKPYTNQQYDYLLVENIER
jgi:hypothetical protein